MLKHHILTVTIITLFLLSGLEIFTACVSNPLKSREFETLLPLIKKILQSIHYLEKRNLI